jgi:inosose dehydratase
MLGRHGLQLVGQFVALVLHEADIADARRVARDASRLVEAVGGDVLVLALTQDELWSTPGGLDDQAWKRTAGHLHEIAAVIADHGLTPALHPHAGTLIETSEQVHKALDLFDVGWCLDTGHLVIGGIEPATFVREHGERIVHVHLKDVDAALAARVRAGELSLVAATQAGLFRPLGRGNSGIEEVVRLLDRSGYERWLVLEQDTAITGLEPPDGDGPVLDVARSIEYLTTLAREREVAQP